MPNGGWGRWGQMEDGEGWGQMEDGEGGAKWRMGWTKGMEGAKSEIIKMKKMMR